MSSGVGFFTSMVSKFGYMQNFCETMTNDPLDREFPEDTRSTKDLKRTSESYSSITKILSVFFTKKRKLLLLRQCSGNTSSEWRPSRALCTTNVFPTPDAPHTKT